jgi:hypothetical protein
MIGAAGADGYASGRRPVHAAVIGTSAPLLSKFDGDADHESRCAR